MYDLPKNSIKYYNNNLLTQKISHADIPLSHLIDELKKYKTITKNKYTPESDALNFYFFNHIFHMVKQNFNESEKLNNNLIDLCENYLNQTSQISKRLFYYQILVNLDWIGFFKSDINNNASLVDYLDNTYDESFSEWRQSGFINTFKELDKLHMTCGDFISALSSSFMLNKNPIAKPYGLIACSTADYIHGRVSLEQMADTTFSLCHNGGSIFMKGYYYAYCNSEIFKFLDIQDSGQIPQWVFNNLSSPYVDKNLKESVQKALDVFPTEINKKVNQKMITNSSAKRKAAAKKLAKQKQQAWNNFYNGGGKQNIAPVKPSPKDKMNKAVLKGLVY